MQLHAPHLSVDSDDDGKDDVYVAHHLPCTINMNGELSTARAFCPFPEPMATFRGRRLQSAKYKIPASSKLVMVEKKKKGQTQANDAESFQIVRTLHSSIVQYEHDDCPSENTSVPLALRWLSVSEALHTPVRPDMDSEDVKQDESENETKRENKNDKDCDDDKLEESKEKEKGN